MVLSRSAGFLSGEDGRVSLEDAGKGVEIGAVGVRLAGLNAIGGAAECVEAVDLGLIGIASGAEVAEEREKTVTEWSVEVRRGANFLHGELCVAIELRIEGVGLELVGERGPDGIVCLRRGGLGVSARRDGGGEEKK